MDRGEWWIILTPEGHVCPELFSGANPVLLSVRVRPADLSVPIGIDPNDFRLRPGPAALQLLLEEGLGHCNAERLRRGLVLHASLHAAAGPPAGLDVISDGAAPSRGATAAATAYVVGFAPLPFGAALTLGGDRRP